MRQSAIQESTTRNHAQITRAGDRIGDRKNAALEVHDADNGGSTGAIEIEVFAILQRRAEKWTTKLEVTTVIQRHQAEIIPVELHENTAAIG